MAAKRGCEISKVCVIICAIICFEAFVEASPNLSDFHFLWWPLPKSMEEPGRPSGPPLELYDAPVKSTMERTERRLPWWKEKYAHSEAARVSLLEFKNLGDRCT